VKNFIDYFIKNKIELLTEELMDLFTFIIHNISVQQEFIVYFFFRKFRELNKL